MKKHVLIATAMVTTISFTIKAQQVAMGRFIFGTTILNVAYQQQNNVTESTYNSSVPGQYAVLSDTLKPKTLGISSSLNLTVGYFITKNLCAGLSFGPGTSSSYTTFFRYYFNHKRPDSAKFDFFLQGNISFAYTNSDHPAASEYYPYDGDGSVFSNSTTDYKTNTTTLGYGIWIGSAYHLTHHWSVEALAGFLYSNTVQSIGSYTTTATYYGPTIINPETTLLPALKNTSNSYQGAFRLMITYRI